MGVIAYFCLMTISYAESPDFPYSLTSITPCPVAISLGGASISNVHAPSAAIHNPASIVYIPHIQLTLSTYSAFHKETSTIDDDHFSVSGTQNVDEFHLAYVGINYPFQLLSKKMAAGISYYPKYSFKRSLSLMQKDEQEMTDQRLWNLSQHGYMSAISVTYGIEIFPQLVAGINCNFWRDDLMDNQWDQDISMNGYRQNGSVKFSEYRDKVISHEDKGINFDFGLLWKISPSLTAGAIVQTRRSNDINTTIDEQYGFEDNYSQPIKTDPGSIDRLDHIQVPMTLGVGISYNIHDYCKLFMDFRQMYWEKFHYSIQDQSSTVFMSGRSDDTQKKLRSHHLNIGTEYKLKPIIHSMDTFIRFGFSICTDRGAVLPEPDTVLGMGFGLNGQQLDVNVGYQYQRYAQQEQVIINDGLLKSDVRNNVLQLSLTYRFDVE